MFRIAQRTIPIATALLLSVGEAWADEVVIKDAKTGERIAEAEIGGEAVEIGGKVVKIERKRPTATEKKAMDIIIPSLDFDQVTLADALDYFRQRARELDTTEEDPNKKGLNIVTIDQDTLHRRILELKLRNVPISTALDNIAEATQTKIEYTEHAIKITDAK